MAISDTQFDEIQTIINKKHAEIYTEIKNNNKFSLVKKKDTKEMVQTRSILIDQVTDNVTFWVERHLKPIDLSKGFICHNCNEYILFTDDRCSISNTTYSINCNCGVVHTTKGTVK